MSKATEKIIYQTLRELLQEKNLDDITVKELVEKSEINRKTFYNHYRSLPDLVGNYGARQFGKVVGDHIYPDNWIEGAHLGFAWMAENRKAVKHVYRSSYYPEVKRTLYAYMDNILALNLDRALEIYNERNQCSLSLSDSEYALVKHFYVGTVFTFAEEWIETGMKGSIDDYVDTMSLLILDNMYPMFDRFREKHGD